MSSSNCRPHITDDRAHLGVNGITNGQPDAWRCAFNFRTQSNVLFVAKVCRTAIRPTSPVRSPTRWPPDPQVSHLALQQRRPSAPKKCRCPGCGCKRTRATPLRWVLPVGTRDDWPTESVVGPGDSPVQIRVRTELLDHVDLHLDTGCADFQMLRPDADHQFCCGIGDFARHGIDQSPSTTE